MEIPQEIKDEMADALQKLRTRKPDAMYTCVEFCATHYWCTSEGPEFRWRVADEQDNAYGQTLAEAMSKLPSPEQAKQSRIAELKAELAKLEATT